MYHYTATMMGVGGSLMYVPVCLCRLRFPDMGIMTEAEAEEKILSLTGEAAAVAYKVFCVDPDLCLVPLEGDAHQGVVYTPGQLHSSEYLSDEYHACSNLCDASALASTYAEKAEKGFSVVTYKVLLSAPSPSSGPSDVQQSILAGKYLYIIPDGKV